MAVGPIHAVAVATPVEAVRTPAARPGMALWRERLFALLHRNAAPASGFFRIPGNRIVELGTHVEI